MTRPGGVKPSNGHERAVRADFVGCTCAPRPIPSREAETIRLDLPRYDVAWKVKRRRGGWPAVNEKTGKPIKCRKVWDALTGNARTLHWSQRNAATREVIDDVVKAATRAGLRPCRHITVQLVWAPGTNRKADPDNLWPLLKVLCDGLARGPRKDLPGLHLVPDDDAQWMTKLGPRIDRPPVPSGLWLEIRCERESAT